MRLNLDTDVHQVMNVTMNEIQKDDSPLITRDANGRMILRDGQLDKKQFGKTKDEIMKDIIKDKAIQEAATLGSNDDGSSYEDFRSILGESRDSSIYLDQARHSKIFVSDSREPAASEDKLIDDIVNEAREQVMKINAELKGTNGISEQMSSPADDPANCSEGAGKQRTMDDVLQEARESLGIEQRAAPIAETPTAENEEEDEERDENMPMKMFEFHVAPHFDTLCGSLDSLLTTNGL
mmetsp:Transcript_2536/g.3732  ORF Transcript_2536/g.3732 Transcript_2536/m.3732 type:complete len:238 (+) Transcript_2536:30-743(+)